MISDKSKEWKNASSGSKYKINSKRVVVTSFSEPKSEISGFAGGYHAIAKNDISAGDIVEEIPVIITHSTKEDLIGDHIMSHYLLEYPIMDPIFEENGYRSLLAKDSNSIDSRLSASVGFTAPSTHKN